MVGEPELIAHSALKRKGENENDPSFFFLETRMVICDISFFFNFKFWSIKPDRKPNVLNIEVRFCGYMCALFSLLLAVF